MIRDSFFPIVFIIISSFVLPFLGNGQTYANKDFYLIDDLILEELSNDDRKVIDSCLSIYHEATDDTTRVNSLTNLCTNLIHNKCSKYIYFQLNLIKTALKENKDQEIIFSLKKSLTESINHLGNHNATIGNQKKAMRLHSKSLSLCKKINYPLGFGECLIYMGQIHKDQGNVIEAWRMFRKSLNIFHKISYLQGIIVALNSIATVHYSYGDLNRALDYFHQSHKLIKTTNNQLELGISHLNIGLINKHQGDIKSALEKYIHALKVFQKVGFKKGELTTLYNLGAMYCDQDDPDEGLFYLKKSIKISKETNNKKGLIQGYIGIGNVFFKKKDYRKAEMYLSNALYLGEESNFKPEIVSALNALGDIHEAQNNFDLSLQLLQRSLKISQKLANKRGMALTYGRIANIYFCTNELSKALAYGNKSLILFRELGILRDVKNSAAFLSKVHEKSRNSDKALAMQQLALQINDSIDNRKTQEALFRQKNARLIEDKEKELRALAKDKKVKADHLQLSFIIYGSLLFLILVLSMSWYIRKRNLLENELNTLKSLLKESKQRNSGEKLTHIPVTLGKKMLLIEPHEISFFNAQNKYVLLNTCNGRSYVVDYTIAKLEDSLPGDFMRVHRSSIINRNKIKEIKKTYRGKVIFTLRDKNNSQVPSSLAYSEQVKGLISNCKLVSIQVK